VIALHDLPRVDASLNALSAVWLVAGRAFIKRGRMAAHRFCMLGAVATSLLFLTSYLIYHAHVGTTRFQTPGWIRQVYLAILATHTVLAVALVPLVAITLRRALRGRFDRHRRIARITWPIWVYVSVTGVVIYWMLYHLDPALRAG
jgi:putative membrane protein